MTGFSELKLEDDSSLPVRKLDSNHRFPVGRELGQLPVLLLASLETGSGERFSLGQDLGLLSQLFHPLLGLRDGQLEEGVVADLDVWGSGAVA